LLIGGVLLKKELVIVIESSVKHYGGMKNATNEI